MNPLFTGITIWSFRRELLFVLSAFLVVLSLPVIAVFILTHTGIDAVSDALVSVDVETREIEIRDPSTGEIVKKINKKIAWPVQGAITLNFGQSSGYQVFHAGIDIANKKGKKGDAITPIMDGKVIYAGEVFWGYGKHIIIDHGDNITSLYAHLNTINVKKDQEVKTGDVIGTMGSTGWSTGPHLHFEIRVYGVPVNPQMFLGIN